MKSSAGFRANAFRCRALARSSAARSEVAQALLALAAEFDAHANAIDESVRPERASLRLVLFA